MCDYSKIQRIIAKMIARRQIIVAAHSIRAFYSVPACVGGVLGVYADERMQDCEYKYCGCLPEFHYIAASAKHSFLPQYPEIFTPITNSYAAPTITAIVHNFLKKYNLFQVPVFEIHNYLLQKGNSIPLQKPDFLASANILNLSKYSILKSYLFFNVLKNIRKLFIEEGYQSIGISDYPFAYLYGLEYIDTQDVSVSILAHLYEIYCPDIMILNLQKGSLQHMANESDFFIFLQKSGEMKSKTSMPINNLNYVELIGNVEEMDIHFLYDKIIHYFGVQ